MSDPRYEELLAAAREVDRVLVRGKAGRVPRDASDEALRLNEAVRAFDPKRHVFGGVVWEEVGERRVPRPGDWWLGKYSPTAVLCISDHSPGNPRHILRPVALEGGDE